ncbi:hypothetical protein [Rhodovulum sp.]|uniref:hypothetical protein n=1 Tax=Rhodovulum sp. TaxID=34009 RepID=UPI0017C1ED24|nr:hypothetical protein [Rhodovulum sp.]HDR27503.1 hypothetical protein [Rhodovulum sp.]
MTGDPIDLDARRTAAEKPRIAGRGRPADRASRPAQAGHPDTAQIDAQLLAGPARTWIEVTEKCRFLLERYAETGAAQDARTRKLIARALGDIARLNRREVAKHDA